MVDGGQIDNIEQEGEGKRRRGALESLMEHGLRSVVKNEAQIVLVGAWLAIGEGEEELRKKRGKKNKKLGRPVIWAVRRRDLGGGGGNGGGTIWAGQSLAGRPPVLSILAHPLFSLLALSLSLWVSLESKNHLKVKHKCK